MKGKTHSTEEIIRILRQADGGETAQSVCRVHNISEQTFYRWKKKYGDMELADAKRLKALEKENAVEEWRNTIGATNPDEAQEGTIRKDFATSVGLNAVHGSDSNENAQKEIAFFFSDGELRGN